MNETPGENGSPQPETAAAPQSYTEKPAVLEKPRRWLVIKSTAVLASVAATNYVCFGGRPVVQLGPSEPPSDPARLSMSLALRDSEAHMRLAIPHLELKNHETSVQQSIWNGYDKERHLQVLWVWDFFRIQSHIALRVALPPDDHLAGHDRWREMIDAIRGLQPGNRLDLEVQSACGDLMQVHILNDPAAAWVPG